MQLSTHTVTLPWQGHKIWKKAGYLLWFCQVEVEDVNPEEQKIWELQIANYFMILIEMYWWHPSHKKKIKKTKTKLLIIFFNKQIYQSKLNFKE